MATVLKPKVEAHGFVDLIAIGAIKHFEEQLTFPLIGNGTIVSGIVKGIACGILDGHDGKPVKLLSSALGVDAGEDLAVGILSMIGGGGLNIGGAAARSDGW